MACYFQLLGCPGCSFAFCPTSRWTKGRGSQESPTRTIRDYLTIRSFRALSGLIGCLGSPCLGSSGLYDSWGQQIHVLGPRRPQATHLMTRTRGSLKTSLDLGLCFVFLLLCELFMGVLGLYEPPSPPLLTILVSSTPEPISLHHCSTRLFKHRGATERHQTTFRIVEPTITLFFSHL